MRTAIIIPARLEATRLPGKPLLMLGELPLVVRVLRQAQKCKRVDEVVVATDSEEIRVTVERHGGRALLTATTHQSGTDRVAEVASKVGANYVINVQGDEPFLDPLDLDAVAATLWEDQADIVSLKRPIQKREDFLDPSVVKVVLRDDNFALYFSRAPIPHDRSGAQSFSNTFRHVGVYGYRLEALKRMTSEPVHPMEQREGLEQLRALAMGLSIKLISARTLARGIDTEADLKWARERVSSLGEAAFP